MEILLIEPDKVTRSHIKVGLEYVPGINVDVGETFLGINKARQKKYDYIIIGHEPDEFDGLNQVQMLREFDKDTDVIVVTTQKFSKQVAVEKTRLHIYSTILKPIDVREFFRLVSRMKERVAGKALNTESRRP